MSKHKKLSAATSNAIHPDEAKYIKNMTTLLSEESGIEKDWIANILLLTKPQNLLNLIGSQTYKEYPDNYPHITSPFVRRSARSRAHFY